MDRSFERYQKIIADFSEYKLDATTEQDIRFRLINRLLTEVLDWDFHEIKTERKNAAGYSDYLLTHASKTRALLEAKRQTEMLVETKSEKITHLKLEGPGLKPANEGIAQAQSYCIEEGVDLAILTNGITWVAYLATRSDGKKPSDGKAIVFPNLQAINDGFAKFFDIFSREGVTSKLYRSHIYEAEGFSLSPAEPLYSSIEESSIRIGKKSSLASDLEEVFDNFFSVISGDDDKKLLLECFVDSKESDVAEKDLEKIASELIHSLEPMSDSTGGQLAS